MVDNNRQHLFTPWHLFLLIAVVVAALVGVTSCGHDDPELKVGYYLSVSSSEAYMASSDDEDQGTMSDTQSGNVLYTTITRMKQAVRNAYPAPQNNGDDAAVLVACDKIYRDYKRMYGEYEKNTICVVKIMRTSLNDEGIVVGSRTLTTYSFGSLPPDKDHAE